MEDTEKLEQELGGLSVSLAKLEWAVEREYKELYEEIKFLKLALGLSVLANVGWALLFGWLAWGAK